MFLKIPFQTSIPRRMSHCASGGEPLQHGSTYVSHLTSIEEDVKREDFCMKCWALEKEGKKKEGIHWIGKIPLKKELPSTPDSQALALFCEYAKAPSPERQKLLMMLTLYLERKKQIEKRTEMKNKQNPKLHYYELPQTGEVFAIETCSLSSEDNEKMINELKEKLMVAVNP